MLGIEEQSDIPGGEEGGKERGHSTFLPRYVGVRGVAAGIPGPCGARGLLLPTFTSEWSPALDTSRQCCEFSLVLRLIDQIEPII